MASITLSINGAKVLNKRQKALFVLKKHVLILKSVTLP